MLLTTGLGILAVEALPDSLAPDCAITWPSIWPFEGSTVDSCAHADIAKTSITLSNDNIFLMFATTRLLPT